MSGKRLAEAELLRLLAERPRLEAWVARSSGAYQLAGSDPSLDVLAIRRLNADYRKSISALTKCQRGIERCEQTIRRLTFPPASGQSG